MRSLKSLLLGSALPDESLKHEKLSRIWGLPIMASDAVSSVAYAGEEILLTLVPALGLLAARYVGLISIPIIILLLILIFSYSQIINNYPQGGGAYVVSKENFGRYPSLLAAACLVVDYILTVAVSLSSAAAAIVSAFPSFAPYKVHISLVCIALITLINLRGMRESSKIFGVPTYLFIFTIVTLVITGFIRIVTGSLHAIDYSSVQELIPQETMTGVTMLLFLRAFSSGCAALTGVEAVSDAVPNFREPSVKTARHVLYMLGAIIIFVFGGTCFLASSLKVMPLHGVTVMSQLAGAVFGKGIMFYIMQVATSLILLLAANTAYNGLPILLSILSHDRYMPVQFAHRGTKLSFSNGILFIFVVGAILLIAFGADTHALIPFYAVGVLISFTISQFGMFVKWIKSKGKGWKHKCIINGVGAFVTFIASIIVFIMKFSGGAWVLAIIIPLITVFMLYSYRYYTRFGKSVSMDGYNYVYKESKSNNNIPCIALIHNINKASLKTFDYAKDISSNVTVLHISTTAEGTERLKKQWEELKITAPLVVIPAPYRDILQPMDDYISEREAQLVKGQYLTVVLTKFVGGGWQEKIFHNQTSFFIASKLSKHSYVSTVLVPFVYSVRRKR